MQMAAGMQIAACGTAAGFLPGPRNGVNANGHTGTDGPLQTHTFAINGHKNLTHGDTMHLRVARAPANQWQAESDGPANLHTMLRHARKHTVLTCW